MTPPAKRRKAVAGETLTIDYLEKHDDGKWWARVLAGGTYELVELPAVDAEKIVADLQAAIAELRGLAGT